MGITVQGLGFWLGGSGLKDGQKSLAFRGQLNEIRASDRPQSPHSPQTALPPPANPSPCHPLLCSSWGNAPSGQSSVGVLAVQTRRRPPTAPGCTSPPSPNPPPLQNPLWRAPQGGGSPCLADSVGLDFGLQPNSDICTVPEQSKDRKPRPGF